MYNVDFAALFVLHPVYVAHVNLHNVIEFSQLKIYGIWTQWFHDIAIRVLIVHKNGRYTSAAYKQWN